MIHSAVFQRFVEDSPVGVMVQTLLETTLPRRLSTPSSSVMRNGSTPGASCSPTWCT